MFVHIITVVWVAEWPPFGRELVIRLTICSLRILTSCNISSFPFLFGWIWVLIAPVIGRCVLVTFTNPE